MYFTELKTKEIIRVSDGKKLGFAEDLIIDEESNSVVALRVPRPAKMFKKTEYFEISFSQISKIGKNVILVGECENILECEQNEEGPKERNEFFYSPKIFKRAFGKKNVSK